MNTEEDTIRVLTRIPFYDMMKLYRSGAGPTPPAKPGEWDTFFLKYGWTWQEFNKHWTGWNGGTGTYSDFEIEQRRK